jgi:hypothetical protein
VLENLTEKIYDLKFATIASCQSVNNFLCIKDIEMHEAKVEFMLQHVK